MDAPRPSAEGTSASDRGDGPRVSLVVATLNERANLAELFERVDRLGLPAYEMLVVDDGSADGTRELVRERSARDPRIRLLVHEGKQTTLRAQCQGIEASSGACVIVMDADLQHPPELLPSMVGALESGAAVVIASRYTRGGTAGKRTAFRWTVSRGAEYLTKVLLPPARRISDPVSGFFGFRREIWSPLNPLYRGYKLLIFILVMAEGQRVDEVPFRFTPRTEGRSKVTGSLAFLRVFGTELLLARRIRNQLRHRPGASSASASAGSPLNPMH
jgi:dolichol-phosphate mannosyltransferase